MRRFAGWATMLAVLTAVLAARHNLGQTPGQGLADEQRTRCVRCWLDEVGGYRAAACQNYEPSGPLLEKLAAALRAHDGDPREIRVWTRYLTIKCTGVLGAPYQELEAALVSFRARLERRGGPVTAAEREYQRYLHGVMMVWRTDARRRAAAMEELIDAAARSSVAQTRPAALAAVPFLVGRINGDFPTRVLTFSQWAAAADIEPSAAAVRSRAAAARRAARLARASRLGARWRQPIVVWSSPPR